jgi:molybdate/tungstate transport system substrate-binding protein
MKLQRSGVSTVAVAAVVVIVVVILVAALVVSSTPAKTTTSTTTSTSVSTATSTLTSTVSGKEAPLVSYSADAYAPEVTALLNNFSSSTGVQVAPLKSGGSTADASAIEAGAPDDVFVSSSLAATSSQYLGNLTANWSIGFATDQMVVAYSNSSTQTPATTNIVSLGNTAAQSNATSDWNNFYTALVSGTVKVGISDPTQDPGGLRGWLALEAAGYLYSGGNSQAYVSTLLKDQDNVTAASAADLVAPLQAGDIQFLFTYKSAAVSDGLPYITLDSHVNLGTASLASFYSKFSYTDSAGTTKGAPIVISVTIPLSVVNAAEALQFVQYVVQNSKSLSTFGVVPLSPCVIYENTPPPVAIQQLVTQGLLVNGGALP